MVPWGKRISHGTVIFANKVWILGGEVNEIPGSYRNDVWSSSDGEQWTQETISAPWSKRSGTGSVAFKKKIWVLGGISIENKLLNDVWFTTDGKNWTCVTANAAWSKRQRHNAIVYDNKIWIIGGYGEDYQYRNDVWYSSDGIKWTQANSTSIWSKRCDFAVTVYHNKLWVIGGDEGNFSWLNDTWYYESQTKNEHNITSAPEQKLIVNPISSNRAVIIKYQLAKAARTKICVYNGAGQVAAIIYNGLKESGIHTRQWKWHGSSGATLRSGIYFIRLEAGALKATKMIVKNSTTM